MISVVIPVYNCEKKIARCLDSVIGQTYKNLEILIVDDGSSDNSVEICREYAKKYDNIVLIEQENQGAAAARRNGVRCAKGDYIGFVDADDYIKEDMYETLVKYMDNAELVTSGYLNQGKEVFDSFDEGLYVDETQLKYFYYNMILFKNTKCWGITSCLWNKLYVTQKAKEIFDEIDSEIFMGEDAEFLYKYALSVNSICITKECKYYYEDNPGSVMNSINPNYLKNVHCLYLSLKAFFEKTEYKDGLLPQLHDWIFNLLDGVPHFMGIERTVPDKILYSNSFLEELKGKKIVVYGAGTVGKNYFVLLQRKTDIKVVLWVDEKWETYREKWLYIEPVEKIATVEYDYVVIAVKKEALQENIRKELLRMGVEDSKIWWKPPVFIGHLL